MKSLFLLIISSILLINGCQSHDSNSTLLISSDTTDLPTESDVESDLGDSTDYPINTSLSDQKEAFTSTDESLSDVTTQSSVESLPENTDEKSLASTESDYPDSGEDYSDDGESESTVSRYVPSINDTLELLSNWATLSENSIESLIKDSTHHVAEFAIRFHISEDCILSMIQLFKALRKQKAWAFRLLDSYGRPSPGFLEGTVTSLGDFDECLAIEFPNSDNHEPTIRGKYCLLQLDFPVPVKPKTVRYHQTNLNLNGTRLNGTVWAHLGTKYIKTAYSVQGFRFGICIPSACSANELEPIISKVTEPLLKMPLTLGPDEECTTLLESIPLTRYSKIAIAFFTSLIVLTTVATVLDLFGLLTSKQSVKGIQHFQEFFSCFSAYQATQSLIKSSKFETQSHPKVIDGLTVLTLFGLIVGHTYFFGGFFKTTWSINRWTNDVPQNSGKLTSQAFINTHLFIDSLFFISGVSLACSILPKLASLGPFKYFQIILLRWLRFIPLIFGVTLFNYLLPLIGSGPIYKHHSNQIVRNCQINWWPHLVTIGNWYGNIDTMCAPQLWYLSADLQLHFTVPMIFFSYQRNIKLGLIVNGLFIVIGILFTTIYSLIDTTSDPSFSLNHLVDFESLHHQFNSSYFPTYLHISPFVFGILIGLIINRTPTSKLSKFNCLCFWVLTVTLSLIAMFASSLWNNTETQFDLNIAGRLFFAGFQRLAWCSSLAWIVFASSQDQAGFLSRFLSSSHFRPLSRLAICIYVVHNIPIDLRSYTFKYTKPWDDHFFISWSLFNIVSAVITGYLLYILLEFPVTRLISLLVWSDQAETTESSQDENSSKNKTINSEMRFKLSVPPCISTRKNGKFEVNPKL